MLTEGFVAIMAMIAACILVPADYFAINSSKEAFAALGMTVQDLPALCEAVEEKTLEGRTGGAVSLAVGMAHIFSSIPLFKGLMSYWYHFAIMFEAVFILTAIDSGTRVGRFFLQEMIGKFDPRFADNNWWRGVFYTSILFTLAWGYLQFTGNINTIWPIFGMCNQLLASCALIIGTTMIIRMGKARYAWVTAVPGVLLACITIWAGYIQITQTYLKKGAENYLLAGLGVTVITLNIVVFAGAFIRWAQLLRIKTTVTDAYGDQVRVIVEE
jgi:carbon starvation protein